MKRCGPAPASGTKVPAGRRVQSLAGNQASELPSGPRASAR